MTNDIHRASQVIAANARIQELLPADARGPIDFGFQGDPAAAFGKLVKVMNGIESILHRKDFYTPQAFPYLTEKLQIQADKIDQLTKSELAALNRSLLSTAYPGIHIRSLPDFVSIIMWRRTDDDERMKPKAMKSEEPFMIYLKGSFLLGFVISSPMVFYHLWSFVAADFTRTKNITFIHSYR